MNNKGVTLIEVIVVMIIMLILAVAASTKFSAYDSLKIDAAAQKIASDIRYVQTLAMNRPASLGSDGNTSPVYIMEFFPNWPGSPLYANRCTVYQGYIDSGGQLRGAFDDSKMITEPFTRDKFRYFLDKLEAYKGITIWVNPTYANGDAIEGGGWSAFYLIFYGALGKPYKYNSSTGKPEDFIKGGYRIRLNYKNLNRYIYVTQEVGRVYITTTAQWP